MPRFHLPYNFIPVNNVSSHTVPYADICAKNTHIRHDCWQQDTQSGRIICSLKLNTPTMVGNAHQQAENNQPTTVTPYQRDGQAAIPANSLRGMVGNIAETLSLSSLRVLEKKNYSVRKRMEDSLSAIGILRKSNNPDHKFDLQPLTLPTVKRVTEDWKTVFRYDKNTDLTRLLPAYLPDD